MPAMKPPSQEQIQLWRSRSAPRRRSEVPSDVAQALGDGWIESKNLVEWLVVDRPRLLKGLARRLEITVDADDRTWLGNLTLLSALKQSHEIGGWLATKIAVGDEKYHAMTSHSSDVVREWSAILVGETPGLSFAKRLAWIKTQADDANAGTREIAWLALRRFVVEDPADCVKKLVPWTGSRNERLRRFASEITRPCGVWAPHIPILKVEPEIGRPILEPLASDSSRYVGNSVANWLNDASKSQPAWVRNLTCDWLRRSPTPETQRIVQRALRTLRGIGSPEA
jgi:3-methyladenine DNA glycosylase AlkC